MNSKEEFEKYHRMLDEIQDTNNGEVIIPIKILKFIMDYIKPYGDQEDRLKDIMYEKSISS